MFSHCTPSVIVSSASMPCIFATPVEASADSDRGRARHRPSHVTHAPHVEVNMVGVEIVTDVARSTGPRAKRLQLVFGLAHVRREKAELAQLANSVAGIGVDRVPTLVDLHGDQ